MEYLKDYLREIVIFVIASSFMINLINNNKNIKYIRIFTGLVLTILLISPLLKFKDVNINEIIGASDINEIGKLKDNISEDIDDNYLIAVRNRINNAALMYGYKADNVNMKCENNKVSEISFKVEKKNNGNSSINIEKIDFSSSEKEVPNQEIIALTDNLTQTFGIEKEKIHIYE